MSTTKRSTPSGSRNNRAFWLALLPLLLAACGCDIAASDSWQETEVKRVTSPDKQFDLVSFEASGGATTAFHNKMYLTKVGEKNRKKGQLVLEVRDAYPIEPKWLTKSMIALSVGGKKIDYFTNYAYIMHGDEAGDEVRFVLK